jgi:hypothetical protein
MLDCQAEQHRRVARQRAAQQRSADLRLKIAQIKSGELDDEDLDLLVERLEAAVEDEYVYSTANI